MRDQDLLGNVAADATEVAEEDITTIITMEITTIITMDTTITITTTTTNTAEEGQIATRDTAEVTQLMEGQLLAQEKFQHQMIAQENVIENEEDLPGEEGAAHLHFKSNSNINISYEINHFN